MTKAAGAVSEVERLDHLLDPVRRVLAYALRDQEKHASDVRYLAANASRYVDPALKLDLPAAVRDMLAEIGARLTDYDGVDSGERAARLREMSQQVTRLDALLGLPFKWRPAPKAKAKAKPPKKRVQEARPPKERNDSGRGKKRDSDRSPRRSDSRPSKQGRGRGRGKNREDRRPKSRGRKDAAPVADKEPRNNQPRFWPYDPDHLGRPLADMGIAPELMDALAAVGIDTPADILFRPPLLDHVTLPVQGAGREIEPGRVAIGGRVTRRFTRLSPDGTRKTELELKGAGLLPVRWGGEAQPWLIERLAPGARAVLVGTYVTDEAGDSVLCDPELGADDGKHNVHLAKYGIEGIDDRDMRLLVQWLLPQAMRLRDPIGGDLLKARELPSLAEATVDVHSRGQSRPAARRRFAYEEALLVTLGRSLMAPPRGRGIGHTVSHGLSAKLTQLRDIDVSDDQQRALEDVKRGLRRNQPMVHLITGEAGSGKGLVALLSILAVAEKKVQVMCLSPDGPSAEARYLFMEPLLRECGLLARLVTDPTAGQRDALKRGELHVVFGTHALLDQELEFKKLGLVVSEEREALGATVARLPQDKVPDLLVMSPVPLPGLVVLSAYGDHDVSHVRPTDPPNILGKVFPASEREDAYARAAEIVREGRQVVVVFPVIDGVDALDAREATRVKAALEADVFSGARVALFHGAMGREERYRVIDDFARCRADVLIATAPIEDGPPIPALAAVVLEQADRTEAGRLYRLRSLLNHSRYSETECLFVIGSVPDEEGRRWVQRVAEAENGHEIFELELAERGIEAFVPPDSPDPPTLLWLDPARDRELLLAGHIDGRRLMVTDQNVRRGAGDLGRVLRERAVQLLGDELDLPEQQPSQGGGNSGRRRRRRRKRK